MSCFQISLSNPTCAATTWFKDRRRQRKTAAAEVKSEAAAEAAVTVAAQMKPELLDAQVAYARGGAAAALRGGANALSSGGNPAIALSVGDGNDGGAGYLFSSISYDTHCIRLWVCPRPRNHFTYHPS
jgi:hypothetical protein